MNLVKKILCILLLTITIGITSSAGNNWVDSLNVSVEMSVGAATNSKLQPLWSHSQEWGVYTQYKQGEALSHIKADIRLANFKYFTMHAGLGLVGKTEIKRSMLHEAYLAGKIFVFDYTAGMQAYSPVAQYDRMTSGNFLMSTNARPTPRVGVGIFDYWSIPQTNNWLQIKGGLYLGKMMNEDYDERYTNRYTKDVIFHEKFAYGRLGGWHLKPYLGLIHSSMMGGTLADGTNIPIDFWKTFFGKGSSKFTGSMRGESTNAAGAHQGLWDIGFDLNLYRLNTHVYVKKPFTDAVGIKFFGHCKDLFTGFVIYTKSRRTKAIAIEYINTTGQNGDGTPDPILIDKNGKYICLYPGDIDKNNFPECHQWLEEHINSEVIKKWEKENNKIAEKHIFQFLSDIYNNGHRFGGRLNYLSNYYYPQGWSVEEHSMSSAYFCNQKTIDIIAPYNTWQKKTAYPNVRISGITFALNGNIADKWDYFMKVGMTVNKGNRIEKHKGGAYSWEAAENYYFEKSKNELYTTLNLTYSLTNHFKINITFAGDYGDLYKSIGLRTGVIYNINK